MPESFSCENLCDPPRGICLMAAEITRVVAEIEEITPSGADPLSLKHKKLAESALDLLGSRCRAVHLGISIADLNIERID